MCIPANFELRQLIIILNQAMEPKADLIIERNMADLVLARLDMTLDSVETDLPAMSLIEKLTLRIQDSDASRLKGGFGTRAYMANRFAHLTLDGLNTKAMIKSFVQRSEESHLARWYFTIFGEELYVKV